MQAIGVSLQQRQFADALKLTQSATARFPRDERLKAYLALLSPEWLHPISGGGLSLRPPLPEDAPYFRSCFSDTEFMKRFHRLAPRHRCDADLLKLLRHNPFPLATTRALHWVVVRDEQAVGLASLVDVTLQHRRAEVLLGFPGSDTGFMPIVAMLLILDFSFNTLQLNKLTSLVYGGNHHAQASTLACGFTQEGFRRSHLRDPDSGEWLDVFENGMLISDYKTNRRLKKLHDRLISGTGSQ